jgi:hypothetical protein
MLCRSAGREHIQIGDHIFVMDPKEFQAREADKLANWVSQTLALKEAKNHSTDGLAAVGQRAQVQIETQELADTWMPPASTSESSAPLNGGSGLTEEQVRDIVREMLEDYATKEWVEEQGYATTEWVDEQGFATEEWVEDQGYATEEWVQEQLEPYATQDWVNDRLVGLATEDWVEEHFVKRENFFCNWNQAWLDNFGYTGLGDLIDEHAENVVDIALNELGITANCNNDGTITVELTGISAPTNPPFWAPGDPCNY